MRTPLGRRAVASRAGTAVRARRTAGLTRFQRAMAAVVRVVLSSIARVRVEGLGSLPREGPLIIVVNHMSNADPPLVGGWLAPALDRPIRFLAKEQLFVGPAGRFLRGIGAIKVRAGGSDVDAYRKSRAVIDSGGVLVVFPEGTRSTTGRLGQAHPGVALLATRTGAPILPVGVSGTDRFLPPGRILPRFGARVTLRVGQPFRVSLDPGLPRRGALDAATDEVMRHIATLVDARHRGRHG